MAKVAAAYLFGSPGDVSEAKKAGIQIQAKVSTDEEIERRPVSPLPGLVHDLRHMFGYCRRFSVPISGGMCFPRFMKDNALRAIREFFAETSANDLYILFYSGHGETGTGNWVFTDRTISFNEVYDLWRQSGKSESAELWIISDSCFAGKWIMAARQSRSYNSYRIQIVCSSSPDHVSYDSKEGGDFTTKFVQKSDSHFRTSAMIGSFSSCNGQWNIQIQNDITRANDLELALLNGKQFY